MQLSLLKPRLGCWELAALVAFGLTAGLRLAGGGPVEDARAIIEASGFQGGLVVHLGCGDGALTAALAEATGPSQGEGASRVGCVIQGLDRDRAALARRALATSGRYGSVTAEEFAGTRLPYADNLVSLLVVDDAGRVPRSELIRVLAPGGSLCMRKGTGWQRVRKPRPNTIDEWTHYLHDASGNAVARDTVVGPPRRLQWVGGPKWSRHHDRMASMNAMASTGGILYYVIDQGPTEAIMLPPEWTLVARDGFCGTVLWKRPLPSWHPHLWPMKSGFAQLPRRLVAVDGHVYLPLGMAAPLSCLDGATGEVVRSYPETHATEEVLWAEGVLYVLANPEGSVHQDFQPAFPQRMWDAMRRAARDWAWNQRPRQLMALRADTGEVVWRREPRVVPLSLAVGSKGVFFHDGERIVRLDRATGEHNWQSEPVGIHFPKEHFTGSKARGKERWQAEQHTGAFVPSSFGPTLVVHRDVVLFAGGDGKTTALSATTGAELWSAEHHPGGHFSPQDLFVIGDRVWSGAVALPERFHSGAFTARNLRSGAVEEEIPCDTDIFFMHHRCHRAKATERYFIPSRTGIELIGLEDRHWDVNHWVRGGCLYGIMPCNGLLYVPPHSCACYMMGKLNGFNALAPERQKSEVRGQRSEVRRQTRTRPGLWRAPQSAIPNPQSGIGRLAHLSPRRRA